MPKHNPLRTILLESLLRSCPSSQAPQASIVDEPVEICGLPRRHKPKSHFFADAEPRRGIRIKLQAEGISEDDCSQLDWLDYLEHVFRKCPSEVSGTLAIYSQ
jgi:hypothetical protein